MQLDDPPFAFKPVADRRPRVPEPLPVKLVAVNDVRVDAAAGLERALDAFYEKLAGLQRVPGEAVVYRAENFDLYVDVLEPPVARDDLRPLRLEVRSLVQMEHKLIDAEIRYVRQKGLVAGDESLLLQDPAGNWVAMTESRIIG